MKNKGFTLVELLAVVVVLGLAFIFILPSITKLFGLGTKTETELIEEKVLSAAKEYANNIDGTFYTKLYKEGDKNYIYKSDLLNAGLITEEEISKLNTFAGVKGEVLKNDKIRYTVEYINNPSNEYENEELYLMIQNLTKEVQTLKNQGGGSSGDGTTNISLLSVYPVGSIYMSENDTSPEELFGGTWVSYGEGRTLVGVDSTQTEFETVGKTGGEKTHTLTVGEIPNHNHSLDGISISQDTTGTIRLNSQNDGNLVLYNSNGAVWSSETSGVGGNETFKSFSIGEKNSSTPTTSNGSSQSHNNLQPYITVYMWKRTA